MSKDNGKMRVALETITPGRAEHDLEAAVGQNFRKLNEDRAQKLAEAMKNGRWEVNGETIKYDPDGILIDGQKRMRACVLAGKPFQTFVVYKVAHTDNIDTGEPRRLAQLLTNRGEINTKELGGALSWLWKHEHIGLGTVLTAHIPHSEMLTLLKAKPQLRDCVTICLSSLGRTIGRVGFFAAFMLITAAKDADLSRWFIQKLGDGVSLKEDDPVRRLRDRLIDDRTKKARLTTKEAVALSIKAWNLTLEGRPCKVLRWVAVGPAAEDFPEFK